MKLLYQIRGRAGSRKVMKGMKIEALSTIPFSAVPMLQCKTRPQNVIITVPIDEPWSPYH